MLTEWLLLGLGVLLTAGTAVFVAAEFALVTLDPGLVDRDLAGQQDIRTRSVRKALRQLSTQLSGAQVGITVTTILLGYTAQPALATLLTGPLDSTPLARGAATGLAAALSLIVINVFSMIFGELVPKNAALSSPLATARAVAPLQRGFTAALRPLILLLNGSANALLRRIGVEPREELSGGRSAQELVALVRRSAAAGTLDEGTAILLTNSIELDTLTAVDVMTDRTRMAVVRRAISVPYERRAEVPAPALMDPAPRVPETVTLGPLLVELREHGLQMAVVVDEYGGTSGVVTLEDVVEELVGDVADEHDPRRAGVH